MQVRIAPGDYIAILTRKQLMAYMHVTTFTKFTNQAYSGPGACRDRLTRFAAGGKFPRNFKRTVKIVTRRIGLKLQVQLAHMLCSFLPVNSSLPFTLFFSPLFHYSSHFSSFNSLFISEYNCGRQTIEIVGIL